MLMDVDIIRFPNNNRKFWTAREEFDLQSTLIFKGSSVLNKKYRDAF